MDKQARFESGGDSLHYTNSTGTDLACGDIVSIGNISGIVVDSQGIASGATGSIQLKGVIETRMAAVVIAAGDEIGWNNDGNPVGGTAGTGAATNVVADMDKRIGLAVESKAATGTTVRVLQNARSVPTPITLGLAAVPAPADGSVVDAESRTAIGLLISRLVSSGIIVASE